MKHAIKLDIFERSDNVEYSTWFTSDSINKHLGPPWTDEELDQIFNEEPETVFAAFLNSELVGVVSIALPNEDHRNSFGITGIAVKPTRQRSGIGQCIVNALLNRLESSADQEWVAFVHTANSESQQFMQKLGWERGAIENDMYRFSFAQPAANK